MKKLSAILLAFFLIFSIAIGSASAATVIGDFDSDGSLTADDAIYLLYSYQFGTTQYPLSQSGDMNSDGQVDADDAVYLLYRVLFGDSLYPLPEDKDQGFGEWRPIPQ